MPCLREYRITVVENIERCGWATTEPCRTYHDEEWGVPVYDDCLLFEMLTLEGAQAGLSWETVLKKRAGYRAAFACFDVEKVAQFTPDNVDRLMQDTGIIRNRAKILSTVNNAHRILDIHSRGETLSDTLWAFVNGVPVEPNRQSMADIPAKDEVSIRMSKDLLKRGFKFVGPTICYAFMQAAGLINDHSITCFRHKANHRY